MEKQALTEWVGFLVPREAIVESEHRDLNGLGGGL